MQRQRVDWDDIKLIEVIGRVGSLAKAAAELGQHQSTATRRLRKLEARAGAVIFSREHQGTFPTEFGLQLIEAANAVKASVESFETILESGNCHVARVKVAAPEGLATYILLPVMMNSTDDFPEEMKTAAKGKLPPVEFVGLGEKADIELLAVGQGEDVPRSGEFVTTKIGSMTFTPVATKQCIDRVGEIDELNKLKKVKVLSHRGYEVLPSFHQWRDVVRNEKSGPDFVLPTSSTLHRSMVTGPGVSMLPQFAPVLDSSVTAAACKYLQDVEMDLWLVVHSEYKRIPEVQTVFRFISTLLRRSTWFEARS